ncbi:Ecp35 [Fulvia fulva]|uniref:Ecp35 n=1 Tax=Passalora fulva TaxID=5499 RepID=A0A1P8YXK3_PASFU|nr:Ecp35 [Fulvia fulva]AQA29239.1 extracellular protein 35 [Fulvia fulva]KAK4629697.1 Ecp35 [Fulvia fulva]KAK4630281.1 Ecp35 [Fulvia fulva]UJO15444.1 Ecp35 [Fulvia fulva]WPV12710.1 Ecp35 [Fulvia fulva]
MRITLVSTVLFLQLGYALNIRCGLACLCCTIPGIDNFHGWYQDDGSGDCVCSSQYQRCPNRGDYGCTGFD